MANAIVGDSTNSTPRIGAVVKRNPARAAAATLLVVAGVCGGVAWSRSGDGEAGNALVSPTTTPYDYGYGYGYGYGTSSPSYSPTATPSYLTPYPSPSNESPSPSPTAALHRGTADVDGDVLNVRSAPQSSARSIRTIPDGGSVTWSCSISGSTVSGHYGYSSSKWLQLSDGGYVAAAFVKTYDVLDAEATCS
jgi:hypothetical protein